MSNSSIWPIDRNFSGAITSDQWTWEWWQWRSTPHYPKLQHYWNLTIRCSLMSYPGVSSGEFYPSAKMQLVYSTTTADSARVSQWNNLQNNWMQIVQTNSNGFNSMSNRLGLFYVERLENRVHCTFLFTFVRLLFLETFFCTVIWHKVFISDRNNLHTVVLFQVFLSNASNYFYSIIVICLHMLKKVQVTNNNLK